MEEEIVGIVPHLLRSTGGIGSKHFTLIITKRRLIIAQFTGQMMNEAMIQAKNKAKKGGKGLLGGLLAGRVLTPGDVVDYTDKYWRMAPDHIIAETQGNVAIDVPSISFAYVEHQVDEPDADSHIRTDRYILTIESTQGVQSFIFDADPQDMDVLRMVLGNRLQGSGRSHPIKPMSSGRPSDLGYPPPPPPPPT